MEGRGRGVRVGGEPAEEGPAKPNVPYDGYTDWRFTRICAFAGPVWASQRILFCSIDTIDLFCGLPTVQYSIVVQ
jgi:hypothetical protein